ncbi:MAG: DUF973 family protein [Sulfolobaceae archaeon]|nr:DUF973 family protein [Sulfolobaceae archaeon]
MKVINQYKKRMNKMSVNRSRQGSLIKYIKLGEIYRNGVAKLYLYVLDNVLLKGAYIEGKPYSTQTIAPMGLRKGYNEVTVYFTGLLNDLQYNQKYLIVLTTTDNDEIGIPAIVVG